MPSPAKVASPTAQAKTLAGFIGKFDPQIAKSIRATRTILRKRYPTAHELIYDNYNFFVVGFSTTERPSDCMFSLAANAKGVNLSFYYGSTLPDPKKILSGSGSQNRFIRLENAAKLSDPDVVSLLRAAVAQAEPALPSSGKGRIIIRSISAKQRPRRDS